MAYHLTRTYTQQKLKAFAEPDYYAELTKTNDIFLTCDRDRGGGDGDRRRVRGDEHDVRASPQRIKDVGVLRILGFKRWQMLISFMLESLTIAFVGGLLGCLLAYLLAERRSGDEQRSAAAAGGGKSVALKMVVDYQMMAMGMLFTLVMGRLGGLVPALSAMRMEILDSLR